MKEQKSMPGMQSLLMQTLGVIIALVFALPFSAAAAASAPYPTKTVRIVIPNVPGGSAGIIGNIIATKLTERLGKQVVEIYQGGGAGVIGIEMAAEAKPDGYTLLLTSSQIILNPLFNKVPYDPIKSFVPITRVVDGCLVLSVHPGVPVNSVKELLDLAKKEPGKLNLAGTGVGSNMHLAAELLMKMAGVKFNLLQFKGGGPSVTDVIGGHSQIGFNTLTTSLPHIKSGKLKALGYSGAQRNRLLPDLPTISEAGVPGYTASQWIGFYAPAGTPKAITDRLYKELEVILTAEENRKIIEEQGGADVALLKGPEFSKFMVSEMAKWSKVIKDANIRVEQ